MTHGTQPANPQKTSTKIWWLFIGAVAGQLWDVGSTWFNLHRGLHESNPGTIFVFNHVGFSGWALIHLLVCVVLYWLAFVLVPRNARARVPVTLFLGYANLLGLIVLITNFPYSLVF